MQLQQSTDGLLNSIQTFNPVINTTGLSLVTAAGRCVTVIFGRSALIIPGGLTHEHSGDKLYCKERKNYNKNCDTADERTDSLG